MSASINTSTSKNSKFNESVLNQKKKSNATNSVRLAGVYRAGATSSAVYQPSRYSGSGTGSRKTKKFLTQSSSKAHGSKGGSNKSGLTSGSGAANPSKSRYS